MNERQHVSISFTASPECVGGGCGVLIDGRSGDMEADVVKWLQCLRHTVAEESEPWNLFSVYRDSILDSTIDALFDFDSTTSVSDFEYYSMDPTVDNRFPPLAVGDDHHRPNTVFMTFPKNDITVSFKPKWSDLLAWKNDLKDSALDGTLSENDEQVPYPPPMYLLKNVSKTNIIVELFYF